MIWFTVRRSLLTGVVFLLSFILWIAPALASGNQFYHDIPINNTTVRVAEGNEIQNLRGIPPAIPLAQSTPTTLTVEIVGSPWVPVDHNDTPGTAGGRVPSVYVIEADVTNTGSAPATNVTITLDYNPSGDWVLLAGEDATRNVAELGVGETYHAYWFAQYPDESASIGSTHQYTVSAVADNADPISESENKHDPDAGKTVEAVAARSTGNNALVQTDINVNVGAVGVAFTMTQVFDLGQNPVNVALSPVGNDDFDPGAYRLLSVAGRFLDGSNVELHTFTDEVYFPSVANSPSKAEVTYTFLTLLPQDTVLCPYAAIEYNSSTKYDRQFCSENTIIDIGGSITLDLVKQVNLENVEQGQILEYTIAYTNSGDQAIQYGWLWDDIPTDTVALITSSISPAGDPDETTTGRVAWNLGTIPVDSAGVVTFSVLVDGNGQDIPDGQEIFNQAEFGISTYGLPNNVALTSTVTSTVQAPTITMSKTDGRDFANPGDLLTYVIQITNSGSIPAAGLVITDELPANVALNGATTPAFDSINGRTLVWNSLTPIAGNGGTLELTIPVRVDPNLSQDGTFLTNTAYVRYRNSAGYTFPVESAIDVTLVDVPETQLDISKTAKDLNGEPLLVGDTIRYTLQVTNTGVFTAYNVTVTDTLPAEVSCLSISGGGLSCSDPLDPLTWDVGQLGPDITATLMIDVKILPEAEGKSVINSAYVEATNVPDPPGPDDVCLDGSEPIDETTCAETPDPGPELSLSKTAQDLDGEPLEVGDIIRYTLQVTNTGTFTAYNVTVTDTLPAEVSCLSILGGGLSCSDPLDPLTWDVGDLGPNGDTADLIIEVEILPAGEGKSIVNTASVTATNLLDPVPDAQVCPDGSTPTEGVCEVPVGPSPSPDDNPNIFLPIIFR